MKVLHIVPWYEPAFATGGTASAVSTLCRALVKKGVEVIVYTTDDDGKGGYLNVPLNQEVNLGGVKVYYFRCDFWWKKKRSFNSKGLIQKLKETQDKYDLIHISSSRVWFEKDAYMLSKKRNIPYIITPHASIMNFWVKEIGNPFLKYFYLKLIQEKVIKGAKAIHFLCEGERNSSLKYLLNKESFIIPNGINIDDYKKPFDKKTDIRNNLNIPFDALLLLYTGRIHPQKNLDLLILSLSEIKKIGIKKEFYFLIIGSVSDKNYYESLIKMIKNTEMDSKIKIFPPMNREDLKEFYWASDIMILPSKVEGISMSIIEALASSLPVLVSNRVANYKEIEQDKAGIVIEPTKEKITEALINIFKNPDILKQLSQNARKSAEKRYDINKVADLMIKAYEDVLTGRRSPELQWR
jgi:glycosyltransferase involved in cell wall biosynthesis